MINETLGMVNTSEPINIVLTSTTNWSQYILGIVVGSIGLLIYLYFIIKSGAFGNIGFLTLSKISRLTKKSVVLIKHTQNSLFNMSMIDGYTLRKLSFALNKLEGRDFDLILHTGGGDVFSSLAISRLLKQYTGKIRAIVPLYSMSGGSLLALTCDNIMMTKNASLGCIDPQISSFFKYGSAKSWERIVKFKGKKAEDQSVSFAMMGKQYTKTIKNHLMNVIDFNLSNKQREKLVHFLTSGDVEHSYALTPLDLEKYGLRITILEDKRLLRILEKIVSSGSLEGVHYYKRKK